MNHHLFTIGNPKTQKGEARGWLTAVLHLAPERSAGIGNVCPKATAGCTALCLNTTGRGGIGLTTTGDNPIQAARRRRTQQYAENPREFARLLAEEVEHWNGYAHARGMKLAVRINGTSDLPALARNVARDAWHLARFYDYTKIPFAWQGKNGATLGLIDYTFSRSERNLAECIQAIDHGINVAVVFDTKKGEPLPEAHKLGGVTRWIPVIDGDAHDLRFLDPKHPKGVIVGLRAKGRARTNDGHGFVVKAAA